MHPRGWKEKKQKMSEFVPKKSEFAPPLRISAPAFRYSLKSASIEP